VKISLLLSLALFYLIPGLHGQVIELEYETVDSNFQNVDLNNSFVEFRTELLLKNSSATPIDVKWTREVDPSCPMEWLTYIGDINMTYIPTISTNIDPPLVYSPFTLNPGETADFFDVFFRPQATPGCCQVKIHFSLLEAPEDILATGTIHVNVNMTDDCINVISTTKEAVQEDDIRIFPNPASDYFTLEGVEQATQIRLINNLGQQIAQWPYQHNQQYSISALPQGAYTLQLFNSRNILFQSAQLLIGHE
jgi:hypothetical protein